MTKATRVETLTTIGARRYLTAPRLLFAVWFVMGLAPLLLQIRSYLKFATPHKITESLVVPPDSQKQTANLTELCPVHGYLLSQVWWNSDPTHYYETTHGRLCNFVVPQYNIHGHYVVGNSNVAPFRTTPLSCAEDSYPYEQYLYHGSIGFYSFYIETTGTFCAKDKTSYIVSDGLGTFDINGVFLARDTGSDGYRKSFWYCIVGAIWLIYRALTLRRSFISCKRYGRRCDQMGEGLRQKEAVVYVQESLRLSAHGATNYHRAALLYLLVEGIMCDLFLIVANDGLAIKIQYVSLGYNLSGLLLMMFEIIESTKWLPEKWRQFGKRLMFNYESSLVGELASAAGLQYFLTGLNGSELKQSKPTALAVSYYFWSLICHGIVVIVILATVIFVRALWTVVYVHWKHHSWAVLFEPCSVDLAFGVRNRMTMLEGYHIEDEKLFYRARALKAFGLLRMEEEDGAEFLVMNKLHWFTVPSDNLFVIGVISDQKVDPCSEGPCAGVISFFNRSLGGPMNEVGSSRSLFVRRANPVSVGPMSLNVLPSS